MSYGKDDFLDWDDERLDLGTKILITLLLIYLAVLFLLARLFEVVAWYEHGQLSRSLLDPMTLSVLKLKALLEQRGISYDSVVEKSELTELVEASGSVTDGEVEMSSALSQDEPTVYNYTGAADFYEQVEDAKDSMWLVEVVVGEANLLSFESWKSIRKKLDKFGVRFGRLHCQLDVRLCTRKAWFTSRLVLALPEDARSKANVAFHTFPGPNRVNTIFDWTKSRVNGKIKQIDSYETFRNDWLSYKSRFDPEVRVIVVSTVSTVPLLLSALAVKFPGRVKIGSVGSKTSTKKNVMKKLGIRTLPAYVIVTQETIYFYGYNPAEYFNFRAMDLFLKSLHPNVNDLFIVSILLTNVMSIFELSLTSGTIWKRILALLISMFKYNVVLLLTWIVLLGTFQFAFLENIPLWGLKCTRLVTTSFFFAMLRNDILWYSTYWNVPVLLLFVMLALACLLKKNQNSSEEAEFWNFSNMATLDYEQAWEISRLRPFDQIFNPSVLGPSYFVDAFDSDKPYVNKDYIKYLPTWPFSSIIPADNNAVTGLENEHSNEPLRNEPEVIYCGTQDGGATAEFIEPGRMAMTGVSGSCGCECEQICDCPRKSPRRNPIDSEQGFVKELDNSGSQHPPYTNKGKGTHSDRQNAKPYGFLEGNQCVICLENYIQGVWLRGLPCFHAFHNDCILTWLNRDNHFCPICRWESYKPKQHDFFTENLHDE